MEKVFGCSVEWNTAEKSITAIYPDTTPITIQMKIGDQTMYVNGKAALIDVPPQIVSGKTLVPLKAVSSSLGVGIGYDNAHKVVVLGLATNNPQEVLAVDAQNYTDIPLADMYGDIGLLKLYTVDSLYTLFPLLEMQNGQEWCLKTFGNVYSEYQDIPGRVLVDAIQSYAKTYM